MIINRIINILNEIVKFRNKTNMLFNPTSQELNNEFNFISEFRLVIDPVTQNYLLADANKYTHFSMMQEAGITNQQNIEGGMYDDGLVWIRGHNIKKFLNKDMTNEEELAWLKSTQFYTNLHSIITDIDIQDYFDWKQT